MFPSYPTHNGSTDTDHVLAQLEKIEERISSLKSDILRDGKAPASTASPNPLGNTSQVESTEEWATRVQNDTIPAILSGEHVIEAATGATLFLGSHSDPPSVLGCRPKPEEGAGPVDPSISCSDQLAPKAYPFASLWAPDTSLSEISGVLPDDSDIIRYVGHPVPFNMGLCSLNHVVISRRSNASS